MKKILNKTNTMRIHLSNNIFQKNDLIQSTNSLKHLKPLNKILKWLGFSKIVGMIVLDNPIQKGEGWEYQVTPESITYKWLCFKLKQIEC
jgi:hypothetical protein